MVFLFSDTQIKDASFVEDLSNLLNTYEVPNLIGSGDLAGIFENIRPRAKQAGMDGSRDQLYNFFVQEVRIQSAPWAPCRFNCYPHPSTLRSMSFCCLLLPPSANIQEIWSVSCAFVFC